jgi:steroid 5-alpha reductase family enzyme
MKKLTDFHIAALSAVPGIVGGFGASAIDIWWAYRDMLVTGHWYLPVVMNGLGITLIFFVISVILLVWSVKRHNETGQKPIQSKDDIDYRIELALRRKCIRRLSVKEKAIKHRRRA